MVALTLLCSGPALAELLVLWLTGLAPDRALAAQVTSPVPWGQFHDLRWLLVFHDSWLSLALEAVALVVVRSAIDALMVRAAWPGEDGPSRAQLLRRMLVVTPVMWLFLLPWTVLGFGMGVVSISWLFFTAIPPVLVVALVCGPAAASPHWWRRPPPRAAVSTAAVVFAGQSVVSLALSAAPAVLWVPVVALAGAGNAWAWRRMIRAVALDTRVRRSLPVAPIVSVGMVAVAVSGAAIAFAIVGGRHPASGVAYASPGATTGPPVLVVSGFDSRLDRSTPPPPLGVGRPVRFSYRGADSLGRPLPYGPDDTHRSLPALVRLMAHQVDRLHASTGRRVAIVAESEGSLVTQVYLAVDPGAPVSRAILLSPLDQPGRVYYPPPGRSGYGLATGDALESLTWALGGFSPVHLPADGPFLRSIVDHAPSLRGLLSCPPPVPEELLEPLADALADPSPPSGGVPAVVVPAFHGGLLSNPAAQRDVDRLLEMRRLTGGGGAQAAEAVLRGAGAGWQVPTLPLSLYTSAPDHPSCTAMTSGLRRWVGSLGQTDP